MIARVSDVDRMFDAMGLLRGRFDNIFDEFDRSVSYRPNWAVMGNTPRTNLYDKGETFELIAEVIAYIKSKGVPAGLAGHELAAGRAAARVRIERRRYRHRQRSPLRCRGRRARRPDSVA